METNTTLAIVLMGVTGSGKTTIGETLSTELGWDFYDADGFHPEENVSKMRQGIALTDDDRIPWLLALGKLIHESLRHKKNIVLACSALKKSYRSLLCGSHHENVRFVHLKGNQELIAQRLNDRKGHFMNPALLESQFLTLEEPDDALTIDVVPSPAEIARTIMKQLRLESKKNSAEISNRDRQSKSEDKNH